jgi:cell division septal protein FtsQ
VRRYWVLWLAFGPAFLAAAWAFVTFPGFRLHELNVTGLDRVARAEVVARAAIDPRTNIWLLDTTAMERRIEGVPYVLSARIHRRPLGSVWIEVAERRPVACVRDPAGREFLIDDGLRVLDEVCTPEARVSYDVSTELGGGPGTFLTDPDLRALVTDARALAAQGDRYRAFSRDAFGQLEATLADGIEVRFGNDDDLDRKQRLVGPILAELGPRAGSVRALDIRAPSAPVVEFRPAPPAVRKKK